MPLRFCVLGFLALGLVACGRAPETKEEHGAACWSKLVSSETRRSSCLAMCERYGERKYCTDAGYAVAITGDCERADRLAQLGCASEGPSQIEKMVACPEYSTFVQDQYLAERPAACAKATWEDAVQQARALGQLVERGE